MAAEESVELLIDELGNSDDILASLQKLKLCLTSYGRREIGGLTSSTSLAVLFQYIGCER